MGVFFVQFAVYIKDKCPACGFQMKQRQNKVFSFLDHWVFTLGKEIRNCKNPHLNCDLFIALLIRNQKSLCIVKVSVVYQETKPIIILLFIAVAKFFQVLLFCSFNLISTNQLIYSLVREVVYILNCVSFFFFFFFFTDNLYTVWQEISQVATLCWRISSRGWFRAFYLQAMSCLCERDS